MFGDSMTWCAANVSRGTKCFSPQTETGYPGGFPLGFLDWILDKGWWGHSRLHVPCGLVADVGPGEVLRADVKAPPTTNATHVFDATDKSQWPIEWVEKFDFILIDKPYTRNLAKDLYDTEECYAGLDRWVSIAKNYVAPGGLLCTLDYELPARPGPDFNLEACWGIYQAMSVRHMMAFQVWRRDGKSRPQGLERWIECSLEAEL